MKLHLLLRNSAARPVRIEQKDDEATVYLYDAIGSWYGLAAEQVVKDLAAIKAGVIHLRINSPGGDVFEARAIATAIQAHPATVIAHIDGIAASAASWIALAANEVEISKGAFLMIHNSYCLTIGDKAEHIEQARLLEKIDESILGDYEAKSGKTKDEIRAWMDAETWFTAEEALAAGLVDRVADGKAASGAADWNVKELFENAPAALATMAAPVPTPTQTECGYRQRHAAALAGLA